MRNLFKNQFKTLLKNPLYPILLGFVLMLTITAYVGVNQLTTRLNQPINDFYETQNVEDFHLTFGQIRFEHLTGMQRLEVCQTLNIIECTSLDEDDKSQMNYINTLIAERISFRPHLYETLYDPIMLPLVENYDIELERNISLNIEEDDYVYRLITINEKINKPLLTDGRLPEGLNEIAIYEAFAKENQITLNDSLTILGKDLKVVGYFYAPDYTFPALKANAINFDAKTQSLILMNEATLFSFMRPVTVKYQGVGDLSLLEDDFDVTDIYTSQFAYLGRNTQMIQTVMPRDYNFRIDGIALETQISETFSSFFIGVFIALTLCLIFFFLAYYIERQKESIKILKILGYTNTSVSVSLLPFSLLLITVSLISYGMGLVLSSLFYPVYKARYQFPSASFEIDLQTLITGLIVPIVSIVLLSALFSFYLIKRVEKPIRYTPLKIRLNHSKNALFKGLLFLVISVLLLFSLYTSQMIDTFKETTTQGNDYAYNIVLAQFDDDALSHQEPYTLTSGSITFINETFLYNPLHLQVYGLSQDSTLKTLYTQSRPINYGVFDNGVIISKHASITHDLNAYDEITLSVGGVARTFRVIAISDELIESALYLDQAILNDMLGYESDSYNAYFTNQAPIQSDRTILRIIDYDRVVSEITTLFDFSNRLIETFLIFAVIIALVMFYFLMHKEFNDALKEHAMLKALGVDGFKLYMMGMFKSYFYITISFIAAYIMTGYLLKFLTAYLYDSLGFLFIFKQAYYVALISYIIVLILAFISTLSIFYRFNKTPLSIHLKA